MPKITKAQFVALQKKYKMDSAIAKELGVSRQAIYQMRMKFGLESVKADHRNRNAEIVKAYKSGIPGTAIAGKFKLSVSQTYRVIMASVDKAKKAESKAVKKAAKKSVKKAPAKKKR
jgi:Zn-dependent peptidase ImmA (M78 family)